MAGAVPAGLRHPPAPRVLADRPANWTELLAQGIDIPPSDALPEPEVILAEIAGSLRHREPLLPQDVLAAVFHGTAARGVRGAKQADNELTDDVANLANDLRGLADALTAFNNYRPGEFIDEEVVAEIAEQRRQREGRLRAAIDAARAEKDDEE